MQREFRMERVNIGYYNVLAKSLDMPHVNLSPGTIYSEIIGETTPYESVAEILSSLDDVVPRCAWFPGDRPTSQARLHTLNHPAYLRELHDSERQFSQFLLEVTKPGSRDDQGKEDRFKFYRRGGLWVLGHVMIRECNHDLYSLGFLPDNWELLGVKRVSGIQRI